MILEHKFRYEVGDLLIFPYIDIDPHPRHIKDSEKPTVLVVESPQDGIKTYTVFDFSINQFRHITPGSYVDRNSRRIG